MAGRIEGNAALKRKWTVQEILDRLALCIDDAHCAHKCEEEPCVLDDAAFCTALQGHWRCSGRRSLPSAERTRGTA